MKKLTSVLIGLVLLSGLVSWVLFQMGLAHPPAVRVLQVEQIQQLSQIITARVRVTERVDQRITGRLGELRIIAWIEGEVLLGPSMDAAVLERVDPGQRVATVVLTPPKLIWARVDLSQSRIEDVRWRGLWWLLPSDDLSLRAQNKTLRDAEADIARADLTKAIEIARSKAESEIRRFGESIGWQVGVRWRTDP